MATVRVSDKDIAEAMWQCSGSARAAADLLGYSYHGLCIRLKRNAELYALWDRRPRGGGEHRRVVSTEQLVEALDRHGSVQKAAQALGVRRLAIMSRTSEPEVRAAVSRVQEVLRARADHRLDVRRREIEDRIALQREHAALVQEMQESWQLARSAWLVTARERGLSNTEMAAILGVSRERVRQLTDELELPKLRTKTEAA